jgi:hypothetical protein
MPLPLHGGACTLRCARRPEAMRGRRPAPRGPFGRLGPAHGATRPRLASPQLPFTALLGTKPRPPSPPRPGPPQLHPGCQQCHPGRHRRALHRCRLHGPRQGARLPLPRRSRCATPPPAAARSRLPRRSERDGAARTARSRCRRALPPAGAAPLRSCSVHGSAADASGRSSARQRSKPALPAHGGPPFPPGFESCVAKTRRSLVTATAATAAMSSFLMGAIANVPFAIMVRAACAAAVAAWGEAGWGAWRGSNRRPCARHLAGPGLPDDGACLPGGPQPARQRFGTERPGAPASSRRCRPSIFTAHCSLAPSSPVATATPNSPAWESTPTLLTPWSATGAPA